MKKIGLLIVSAALACATQSSAAHAAVKLPPMFSDHMVLQREISVPVWGTASPGEKVTVKFRDQQKSAEADKEGKWALKLDALKPGGPDSLSINDTAIQDVLVGDVWVGSGQSNMAMGTSSYTAHDEALTKNVAGGPYLQLRIIKPHGTWQESTPANLNSFSAILFSFGLPLQKEINVPVGLMVGAVVELPRAWLAADALNSDPAVKDEVQKAVGHYDPKEEQQKYEKLLDDWEKAQAAAKAPGQRPQGKPKPLGKPGEMSNGQQPGYLFKVHIEPYIPYAIKGVLWDQGESGTAVRDVDQYTLMGALIRGWRKEWGQGEFPFLYIQKPSGGGIAWDPKNPLTVNASPFDARLPKDAPSGVEGVYRETHIKIRQYPNTFMVTASDLGGGTHPTNKWAYGLRASRVALGTVYGQKVEIYGPVFEAMKIDGDKIRVTFTHVGQGLVPAQSEKVQGFEVAGEDKKFHWADATIEGDAVIVHSNDVSKPIAVRYAWSGSFPWANLFNKDGLPAQTFPKRLVVILHKE